MLIVAIFSCIAIIMLVVYIIIAIQKFVVQRNQSQNQPKEGEENNNVLNEYESFK